MQGELSAIGELVLCGTQIIVPKQLRCQALKLAHEGHPETGNETMSANHSVVARH